MTRRVEVCWVPCGIPEQDDQCEKTAALAARLWEVTGPTALRLESSGRANALLAAIPHRITLVVATSLPDLVAATRARHGRVFGWVICDEDQEASVPDHDLERVRHVWVTRPVTSDDLTHDLRHTFAMISNRLGIWTPTLRTEMTSFQRQVREQEQRLNPGDGIPDLVDLPDQIHRVVFLAPRVPEISGGSASVMNLSQALVDRGIAVRHLSVKPGTGVSPIPTRTIIRDPELHRGPALRNTEGQNILRNLLKVAFKRVDHVADILRLRLTAPCLDSHDVLVSSHALAAQALHQHHFPTDGARLHVGQHHSQYESLAGEPWLYEAIPAQFSSADAFTALTDADAQKFHYLVDCPCFGLPNALPSDLVDPPQSSLTSRRAVVLARFSPEKQLPLMARAFARAVEGDQYQGWILHIHGAGPEEDAIRTAIRECQAEDRVIVEPPTRNISAVYQAANLNLLASSSEGFGMTIIEAAAHGVPSLAFDVSPGVHGLLSDGAGWLVDEVSEDAYCQALQRVLGSPEELHRAGRTARSTIARSHEPQRIADEFAGAINQLVDGESGTPS
ncbi:glycosyltransferase [Cutibacterium avidum]|uniref:glycosyltransferase n=1 Tax=Cutibacterium TaxID=1912216 RepID=UPI002FEEDCC9